MEKVTNDIDGTIGDKVMFAFEQDYNDRYPDLELTDEFRKMLHHYISLAAGIASTNIVELIRRDFKASPLRQIQPQFVVDYLNTTSFQYKQIIDENEQLEAIK